MNTSISGSPQTYGKSPIKSPGDGKSAACWVWPYGAANGTSLAIAQKQGYQLAFTTEDGLANVRDLGNIPRLLIAGNPSIKTFANTVSRVQEFEPVRVMHVDLDYVYDPDPAQQTKNINKLVQRVYDMKISHVFLRAFSIRGATAGSARSISPTVVFRSGPISLILSPGSYKPARE